MLVSTDLDTKAVLEFGPLMRCLKPPINISCMKSNNNTWACQKMANSNFIPRIQHSQASLQCEGTPLAQNIPIIPSHPRTSLQALILGLDSAISTMSCHVATTHCIVGLEYLASVPFKLPVGYWSKILARYHLLSASWYILI